MVGWVSSVYLSIQVDVHLSEGGRGQVLAARLLRVVAVVEEVEQVLDDADHLLLGNRAVAVDVENPEDLLQVGLRRPVGHDVENDHELPEVDVAVAVGVVHPEDVLLQLIRVGVGVARLHHGPEVLLPDFAVGVFPEEVFVVLVDLLAADGRVVGDELQVLFG